MTDVATQTKGLTKAFKDTSVPKGVDLLVRRGEIFVLLGSNGPGTTTTVNILATLGKPDSGKASVCGFDTRSQPGQCAELQPDRAARRRGRHSHRPGEPRAPRAAVEMAREATTGTTTST